MTPERNQRVIGEGCTIGPIRRSDAKKSFEQLPNGAFRQVARDENQPGSMIVIGPAIEPNRGVKDMLNAVHNDGRLGHFGKLHDALEPQQLGAVSGTQQLEKHIERTCGNRFVGRQDERADVIVVAVDVVAVVMVFVRIGLLGQPFFDVRNLSVRVVEAASQQSGRYRLAAASIENRCCRVKSAKARHDLLSL